MYMECQGTGYPTVVFVAGAQDRAETWSTTEDPSKQAVLPAIAETNRVCAYDRPGTILATGEGAEDFEPSRSDPVDQPTTLQDHVDDLHALLKAPRENAAPMLWLGIRSEARSQGSTPANTPKMSRGSSSSIPPPTGGQCTYRRAVGPMEAALGCSPSEEALAIYPDLEWFDHQRNIEQALAAAPLKPMPLIVLSSDERLDLTPYARGRHAADDGRGSEGVPHIAL